MADRTPNARQHTIKINSGMRSLSRTGHGLAIANARARRWTVPWCVLHPGVKSATGIPRTQGSQPARMGFRISSQANKCWSQEYPATPTVTPVALRRLTLRSSRLPLLTKFKGTGYCSLEIGHRRQFASVPMPARALPRSRVGVNTLCLLSLIVQGAD